MNITIRKAVIKDTDKIIELLEGIALLHHEGRPDLFKTGTKKYDKQQLKTLFKDENRPVFVAVDELDQVVGYCFCIIVNNEAHAVFNEFSTLYIDDFCVDANYRGAGIGKKLMHFVKEFAKEIGVYNIDLNVWEFNESAIRFYESCGFSTQRRRMEIIL